MQIAMLAAGFSAEEADALRRSMGAWRRRGELERFERRLLDGMAARGYAPDFAQAIVRQIRGFGAYGFPESHAASFALLAWASAWLKCHEPAAFLAALLNAQPMGFYAPAQLVQDARRHGVVVHPVDVRISDWDCTLEPAHGAPDPAVRLGLRLVYGLGEAAGRRVVAARRECPWTDVGDLARRAALDRGALQALARADALRGLAGHRRRQWWAVSGWHAPLALERAATAPTIPAGMNGARESNGPDDADWQPPPAPLGEEVWQDYAGTGLSLRAHPLALLRPRLPAAQWLPAQRLRTQPHGRLLGACGLVTARQKPATAQGVLFLTLEDETGTVPVIVWRRVQAHFRQALLQGRLLAIRGQWQRQGDGEHAVCHLIAGHVQDLSLWLGELAVASRDFH